MGSKKNPWRFDSEALAFQSCGGLWLLLIRIMRLPGLIFPVQARTGWQVRLQRRGVKYAKYFGDRIHGSSGQALVMARQWRDALLQQIQRNEQTRICTRSTRNRSGVVGVSRVTVVTNGATYQFWQATWSPAPGKRRCIKFSIKRYGNEEAFRLAVEAREEAISH